MTAAPRLLSLRLQGFKSFAARTVIEFGPGINAVVGPNGSGKSNLADALRWALGEQGKALRSRKSEDVIFAGSERKAALGMADVTLVLDNADGLLPVEYAVLELGRRLYRSGENEYLLNHQRVRLKDLVDLLDAAHLADNAFLFIGQGMVDQALALRPEERRPLFEEVAGVRRHERRRRRAEEQLLEAEANLARVEDILAELRPQSRRLAAQAQQQASRETAGTELAAALEVTAHARWHASAARGSDAARSHADARREVDRAITALGEAETTMVALRAVLAERAAEERRRRADHDAALASLTGLRIREAQLAAERDGIDRESERLLAENAEAQAEVATLSRVLAEPALPPDLALEAAVAAAARALSDAAQDLAAVRASSDAREEAERTAHRAAAVREADREAAQRRWVAAGQRAAAEQVSVVAEHELASALTAAHENARQALSEATEAERAASAAREAARGALDAAEAGRRAATERAAVLATRLAGLQSRLELLEGRRAEEETRGIARAARRRGGRRLDDGLQVEPGLRAAVEAVLGESARGYLVPREAVPALAGERGIIAVERDGAIPRADRPVEDLARDPRTEALRSRVLALGGGFLADAVREDPAGVVRRLLGLAVWLPDLAGVLEVQALLPPGGMATDRAGTAVSGSVTIALGRVDGTLERRAEEDQLRAEVARVEVEAALASAESSEAASALALARAALEQARAAELQAAGVRRRGEDHERLCGREAEAAAREAAWHVAQATHLEAEASRARAHLDELSAAAAVEAERDAAGDAAGPDDSPVSASLDALERSVVEERSRHDRLVAELGEHDRLRRDGDVRRAGARAALAQASARVTRTDAGAARLADRRRAQEAERDRLAVALADAGEAETQARAELERLAVADEAQRRDLADAEASAVRERERLRAAEDRSRSSETADLQARLELDLIREQVLVELAGLGEHGLSGLLRSGFRPSAGPVEGVPAGDTDPAEAAALEAGLEAAIRRWTAESPPPDRPGPARLGQLRRRYHDLGAANPFAVAEYAELRARLDLLEAQEQDLRRAIADTRRLIAELGELIAGQFRATFRALEGAFEERFRQLFGGGHARLSLTDPGDLSATGVEIVARPPGKKAQALAMLSGGERALTAVALLFAMLEVRPVPFCVLDEVDAALDEANIGRFADALRGLAASTQFIVITHNRGTIEAADALYGVTVGEDSVSRVISLRLEEATALSESSGGRR